MEFFSGTPQIEAGTEMAELIENVHRIRITQRCSARYLTDKQILMRRTMLSSIVFIR